MAMNAAEIYALQLKEKSPAEISSEIQNLRNEIQRLKDSIEYTADESPYPPTPQAHKQLSHKRLCLEKAKEALRESGVPYHPSEAEQRAEAIDKSIPYLSALNFSIGAYLAGRVTLQLKFYDDGIKVKKEHLGGLPLKKEWTAEYPQTKALFMKRLQNLHLGEWDPLYESSAAVLDGCSWNLELRFSNGQENVKYKGSDKYPYNFESFCELLEELINEGIDAEGYDE